MKFRAHETFSIRKGWLHKGMRHVINNPRVFVDKDINSMDEFGLGANMVKALRYWLQATGLTTENLGGNNRNQELTEFGHLVWNNDSYLEEDGTLFLIHYFLSTNKDLATAWYYFFNIYKFVEITQDSFVNGMRTYLLESDYKVTDRALGEDFDCIIKTYYDNGKNTSPENNMSCPLSELGLIIHSDEKDKTFLKHSPNQTAINPLIILAIIIRENGKCNGENEIKISKLETDECNVGKVFNLDTFSIASYLDKLQNMGLIKMMSVLFDVESHTITYHLQEIFKSGELDKDSTTRKFRVVQTEGTRQVSRDVDHYNLDAVISVGYRVNSIRATQFRRWATQVLKQFAVTGYFCDIEKLVSYIKNDGKATFGSNANLFFKVCTVTDRLYSKSRQRLDCIIPEESLCFNTNFGTLTKSDIRSIRIEHYRCYDTLKIETVDGKYHTTDIENGHIDVTVNSRYHRYAFCKLNYIEIGNNN